jgi:hypothetical protein
MALPPPGYLSDPARTESEMKAALEALRDALASVSGASAPQTLAIASGAVTPTQGDISVDTEGGAASDDLTNILPTSFHDGAMIYVRTTDGARDVTVKHAAGGTGQIILATGTDLVLGDPKEWVQLRLVGTQWQEVERSSIVALPPGVFFPYPGSALPTPAGSYVWCRGQTELIASYPALYALLGTGFGGDGATTFGIPNLKGRLVVGLDPGDADYLNVGQLGGVKTRTPTWSGSWAGSMSAVFAGNPLPGHLHRLPILSAGGPWYYMDNAYGGDAAGSPTQYNATGSAAVASVRPYSDAPSAGTPTGSVTGTVTGSVSGAVSAVDLRNPYFVSNVIMKT